jgi:FtsP/CotA-like multicopper oxidase with cupredoxin domain
MKYHSLLLIGALLLAACVPSHPNQMGGGMMQKGGGMMQGSFLPARDRDVSQLPEAKPMSILEVNNGDTITLNPELVRTTLGGNTFAMYAYNGQFPGPTLKVKQGSTFTVNVTNNIDQPTTIHWHGVRLANNNDGVPGLTQEAIEPGDLFSSAAETAGACPRDG